MKLHIISTSLLLALATSLSAQDLSKEIVIEKEIIPQERQASRHNITPTMSLSPISVKPLSLSESSVGVQVPSFLTTLEPAQGESIIGNSPYRGYAGIGYFPHPNFGASAGYRIMNTQNTILDVYGQYNFNRYERENLLGKDVVNRKSALTLGVFAKHKINDNARINAHIDYSIYNYNVPQQNSDGYNQRANRFGFGSEFISKAGNLDYNVGIKYGYFGFAHIDPFNTLLPTEEMEANNENLISILGGASLPAGENSKAGIDVDATFLNYKTDAIWSEHSHPLTLKTSMLESPIDGYTRGAISFNPYYSLHVDNIDARVGADISFAIKSGKTVHIAPDVNIAWRPIASFGVWAKATGGQELNTLNSLFQDCRYMSPLMAHRNSDIKYDLQLGMAFGPFQGFTGKLYGNYASTEDWLMQSILIGTQTTEYINHVYSAVDLKGWLFGASLAYDYNGIASLELSYEMTPSKYDKGYYSWRDRAKRVFSASLSVRPIEPLNIAVNYRLRQDRAAYSLSPYSIGSLTAFEPNRIELGDVNDLSLTASYAINKQLSIFAEINNLLSEEWQDCYGVTTAPINGLIGVGYKF